MLGLFGSSSPFDGEVERVTNEKNKREDWGLIMDLCDKVKASPTGSKDCLKSINKRLNHQDPHVVMQSITLLDACVSNCGKPFMLEVASRDFENEFRKILNKSQPKVQDRLRSVLRKWAEGDFKSDSQFSLIPSLYNALKAEGMDFSGGDPGRKKQQQMFPNNPNAVFSQEEEDDIAKAIQLSLQEGNANSTTQKGNGNRSPSIYPSTIDDECLAIGGKGMKLKARALYDFEAAEDNELTFKAGEIVVILDNSDANWWKGSNYRGEGLFPSNFVTTDLDDSAGEEKRRRSVQFNDEVEVNTLSSSSNEEPEINEEKLDQVLNLLHDADPTSLDSDPPKLLELEKSVNAMGPLIDTELEAVDRRHAELTRLSTELVDALNLYHQLMREAPMLQQSLPYSMYSQMNGPPQPQHFPQNPHYPPSQHQQPPMYSMHHHPGMPPPQSIANQGQNSYIPPQHPGMNPPQSIMNDQSQGATFHPPPNSVADMNPTHSLGPPGVNDSIHFVSSAPPPTPPLASDPHPPPQYANPGMVNNGEAPVSIPQYPYMQQSQYPPQQIM